jgi:thermolabile hemolysin
MFVPKTSILNVDKINQLYIFGDSLSDVGNIYRVSNGVYPPNPPYYQGRYSNGLVWVEYLASKLALNSRQTINLANGGATTASVSSNGIPGLLAQVYGFTKARPDVNPDALYIIWAGANDYLYDETNPAIPVENLSRAIQSLSQIGANKILVGNLPDLGNLPATRNSSKSHALTAVSDSHNRALTESLNLLQKKFGSDTRIIKFDAHSLYQEAISNPQKFDFTNVTNACLSNLGSCDNSKKFLFWDGIHPTTTAHQILAEAALKNLNLQLSLQHH